MGASQRTLWIEIAIACGFSLFAILGFKRNLWFVVAGAAPFTVTSAGFDSSYLPFPVSAF